MPFVTTLRLLSGDREALDAVAEDIRETAERKGVELRGPHTSPPDTYRVPLFRRLDGSGGRYGPWEYTVYERVIELSGHDEAVRHIADWDFPSSMQVEFTVEQVRSVGSG